MSCTTLNLTIPPRLRVQSITDFYSTVFGTVTKNWSSPAVPELCLLACTSLLGRPCKIDRKSSQIPSAERER